MTDEQKVLVETRAGIHGSYIGLLTLNKPKALNALDFDMAQQMLAALKVWQHDSNIQCVVISGAGEKAFCAGGDVVSMHKAMAAEPKGQTPHSIEAFFTKEYSLDYLIRVYPKPIVVIGHGVLMGGGMGLFTGASHRVVTPSTRMAMPEITIGLYPDVGGTYFLPKLPPGVGMFLGLTGASFNAADALAIGLADVHLEDSKREDIISALQTIKWSENTAVQVSEVLSNLSCESVKSSSITEHKTLLATLANCSTPNQIMDWMSALPEDDKWLNRAAKTFTTGSPITANIVLEQLKRGKNLSLAECFRLELSLSCRCAAFGEFEEGVRALLIDKDGAPNWQYTSMDSVPTEVINTFFTSLWDESAHPLNRIEQLGE